MILFIKDTVVVSLVILDIVMDVDGVNTGWLGWLDVVRGVGVSCVGTLELSTTIDEVMLVVKVGWLDVVRGVGVSCVGTLELSTVIDEVMLVVEVGWLDVVRGVGVSCVGTLELSTVIDEVMLVVEDVCSL